MRRIVLKTVYDCICRYLWKYIPHRGQRVICPKRVLCAHCDMHRVLYDPVICTNK